MESASTSSNNFGFVFVGRQEVEVQTVYLQDTKTDITVCHQRNNENIHFASKLCVLEATSAN